MGEPACRACRGGTGHLVLDLGEQPACDYFPRCDDPGPDPVYPLQMWLCGSCGLAQLVADPTVPQEPKGAEPAALVAQAADAVARVAAAGLLDELCLTVGPVLAGPGPGRVTAGAPFPARPMTLAQVLEEDGFLFCRYLVDNRLRPPGRR